jgi:hypothetical protein
METGKRRRPTIRQPFQLVTSPLEIVRKTERNQQRYFQCIDSAGGGGELAHPLVEAGAQS